MQNQPQQPSLVPPTFIYKIAVSRSEAAQMLSISPATFDKWVQLKKMPRGIKEDGVRRWDVMQLWEAWRKIAEKENGGDDDDGENPLDDLIG